MRAAPPPPTPVEEFEEDPRYKVAWRELWLAVGYWLAFTVVVTATAWLLGGNKDPDELAFVLGFPAWFFWSSIVCSLAFSVIPYFIVRHGFTEVPLTADGRDEPAPELPAGPAQGRG